MESLSNYIAESMKPMSYRDMNKVEELVVNNIFIPFCNQFGLTRVAVTNRDQFDDIDSIINNYKIQEKSGIKYSDWVLLEVYNDINPLNKKTKLEGWGLITKADYHVFIYRGAKGLNIDWSNVHIAKYESSKIKEVCRLAVGSEEFQDEVAQIKESILNGSFDLSKYQSKKIRLTNGITAFINCNSSELNKNDGTIKYAITIKVHKSKLGSKQSLYKYTKDGFKKL
jgi:hypothetical protein